MLKAMIGRHKHQSGFSTVEILYILIVLVLLSGAGWYVYKHHQSKPSTTVSRNTPLDVVIPPKQGSKIESVDDTYNQYINYDLGISLTYSKEVEAEAACQGTAPQINIVPTATPVTVYPDTANHKIFVAASKFVTSVSHQISPGTYQGRGSCTVGDSTLAAIENPTSTIEKSSQVLAVEFDYATVKGNPDLDAFVASRIPTGMVIDHTIPPSVNGQVYTYSFKYTGSAEDPPQAKWYSLIYNPSRQLAVFWVTPNTQFLAWQGVPDSSGQYTQVATPSASFLQ
jgi:hypothetical protein